jgi:transcriptional regulator with XRE-family HTH domain
LTGWDSPLQFVHIVQVDRGRINAHGKLDNKNNTVNETTEMTLGQTLRSLRMDKGITLREMARRLDLTPTYVSLIEQNRASPPTEERIRQIGQILQLSEEQVDQLIAMAGRVPEDLHKMYDEHPHALASFLRTAKGLTPEDFRKLTEVAEELKKTRDG